MKISNPKAKANDIVMALNYRFRPPKWEEAECGAAEYKLNDDGVTGRWFYTIYINRGKRFFIYVGDEGIRKVNQ